MACWIASWKRVVLWAIAALALTGSPALGQGTPLKTVEARPGVVLHYTDTGSGPALVFVHGSTNDYRIWSRQAEQFSGQYRVITYSRRHDYPNDNPAVDGYSAKEDAEDLAGLIAKLELGQVHIVAHSYGALATLFLLQDHPNLVKAAVLAEPPAVPLLRAYPPSPAIGRAMEADVQNKLVAPMSAAFRAGDGVGGMRAFMDYVVGPGFYMQLPESERRLGLENAREWDVIFTRGELFPPMNPEQVRLIRTPVLLLAGSETNAFLLMIHETLRTLLPNVEEAILEGAPHPMFSTHAEASERAVRAFLERH